MKQSYEAQQALWVCLVETQKAIALHMNDTTDPRYISELAAQHTLNSQVLHQYGLRVGVHLHIKEGG